MTLQSSGAISVGNISTELGTSATGTRSLNDTTSRNLAGVASGAISMSNFYGKANVTFSPVPGSDIIVSNHTTAASSTFTSSQAVTWTWTAASGISANQTQGFVGTSITFTANKLTTNATTITATLGSQSYTFTFEGGG